MLDAAPPPPQKMAAQRLALRRWRSNCPTAHSGWSSIAAVPGRFRPTLPRELVEGLRTTAAHSTLVLADTNSTNILPDGSLGKGVEDVTIDRSEDNDASRLEASHDGYVRAFGLIHKRSLMLGNDGKELRGADQLIAKGRKQIRESAAYAVRFHLAPGVEATITADGMGAILRSRGAPPWNFRCRGGNADHRGKPVDRRPRRGRSARRSLSSSAKCRHWAAKSAGSSAARANQEGLSMTDLVPVRRALISLSDKTGLDELAAGLARHGVEIVSTGGTAAKLREIGAEVRDISDLTGFPEMMDGRVKTLHPKVHGGLLGVRDNPEHAAAMEEHDIAPIDLVVVNLYPFLNTVMSGADRDTIIENIDIGGPSMVRSAAKNHAHVAIVTDPGRLCRAARPSSMPTTARRRSSSASSSPPRPSR